MIIKAINNIYKTAIYQLQKRSKSKKLDIKDCKEGQEGLIPELIKRLQVAGDVVEDLIQIAELEPNFDRNKAYEEEEFLRKTSEN